MNYKAFAAGVAVGVAGKYVYDAVRDVHVLSKEARELIESVEEEPEFEKEPPDEMIGRDEITPEDIFGDVMESFDNEDGGGSTVELGDPGDFEDIPGFFDADSAEKLEEQAQTMMDNRVLASLQDGPKEWDDIKAVVFGGFQMGGYIEQVQNQALDESLTRLREEDEIIEQDDGHYALAQ